MILARIPLFLGWWHSSENIIAQNSVPVVHLCSMGLVYLPYMKTIHIKQMYISKYTIYRWILWGFLLEFKDSVFKIYIHIVVSKFEIDKTKTLSLAKLYMDHSIWPHSSTISPNVVLQDTDPPETLKLQNHHSFAGANAPASKVEGFCRCGHGMAWNSFNTSTGVILLQTQTTHHQGELQNCHTLCIVWSGPKWVTKWF